jgi:hypothetical protein
MDLWLRSRGSKLLITGRVDVLEAMLVQLVCIPAKRRLECEPICTSSSKYILNYDRRLMSTSLETGATATRRGHNRIHEWRSAYSEEVNVFPIARMSRSFMTLRSASFTRSDGAPLLLEHVNGQETECHPQTTAEHI